MRTLLPLLAILLLGMAAPPTGASASPPAPTERDWMINLVETLGLSFGLPDEPEDEDYLAILDGARSFRFEAELTKQPDDMVSVKDFRTFGNFSGTGWVSGIATPTRATLKFLLPRSGLYRLSVSLRHPGFRLHIAGQTFGVDGPQRLEEVAVATVELAAGPQEVIVDLPPDGAIDYLQLVAPDLVPIEPLSGWHPDNALSRETMAISAARAIALEPLLPPSGESTLIEAETASSTGGAVVVSTRFLGEPSGGAWLRAGAAPSRVRLDFVPPGTGVYDLWLRGLAEVPTEAVINDRYRSTLSFPPYLQTLPAGTFFLSSAANALEITLSPRAGFDALILKGRRSTGSDYRQLIGLPAEDAPPSLAEIDALLALLATFGPLP